ncbi:tetratricopeptide repeat protein [Massilia sp. TSP1-1-2]|uniref:LytR C-terminal domain-containing protein n=1 Tax=Massilia sp. TSP1-1-2 TaxID=2804649 RepID=UPI003CFB05C6
MQTILKRLSLLVAGSLLLACAGTTLRLPSGEQSAIDAEHAYLVGRTHHLERHPEQALRYYQAALQAAPMHVDARNGLASLYAEQGELDKAIALWESLTDAASGPESAYMVSNLGYAYFLRGDLASAQAALEKACLLDPLNYRAWHHLGNVLGKAGQSERAEAMYRQAAALLGHDFKADYALAPRAGVAAIDEALKAAREKEKDNGNSEGWAQTEVRQTEGGVFILRRVEADGAVKLAAAPSARAMLEIRNGNGVGGMARKLARTMNEGSTRVVRLTNQKGFGVLRSRIEYSVAFRNTALRLAERVGAMQLVQVESVGGADIRLVIGRDMKETDAPVLATARKAAPEQG